MQGQTLSPKATASRPDTAAQAALSSVQNNKEQVQGLLDRLQSLASRVGQSVGIESTPNNVPKAVHAGIIGSIHETSADVANIIQECFETLSRIETQV